MYCSRGITSNSGVWRVFLTNEYTLSSCCSSSLPLALHPRTMPNSSIRLLKNTYSTNQWHGITSNYWHFVLVIIFRQKVIFYIAISWHPSSKQCWLVALSSSLCWPLLSMQASFPSASRRSRRSNPTRALPAQRIVRRLPGLVMVRLSFWFWNWTSH